MEPFKITCVTCRARLSVRDESAIGAIVACPRCGSMVQIIAPANAASPAPLRTGRLSDQSTAAASTSTAPHPLTPAATAPPVLATAFEDVTAFTEDNSTLAPIDAPTSRVATPAAQAAASAFSARFLSLAFAGALAGSALVATALWLLDDSGDPVASQAAAQPTVPRANEPNAQAPESNQNADAPDSTKANPAANSLDPPEPTSDDANDAGNDQTQPAAAEVSSDDDPLHPRTPDKPTDAAQPPDSDALPPGAPASPSEPSQPTAETRPRLRIDPLDVDPEGLNLSTLLRGPVKDPLAESQLDPAALEPAESDAPAEPPPDAVPDDARLAARQAVRRDAADPAAPADAAVLLARRIPAVEFQKMALCRLLDLAGQLGGVPVSVAPHELRRAAVSAASAASVDVKNATLEELLAAALKPLRLAPVVAKDQVVLVRIGEDKPREIPYAVDDLATSGDELNQLAGRIQQLVAPETWAPRGGEGKLAVDGQTLRINHLESVQYETLLLLERYRLTAGLTLRSKYPAALLAPGAAYVGLADRMSGSCTFTFSQYTPLRETFRHWQEELAVAVLVDWPALAADRITPQTRIACSAANKPWAEAIDDVLTPLGLAWRAVDRRTIEITTLEKAGAEPQLELYRLAAGASVDAEQLKEQIDQLAAEHRGTAGAVPFTAVEYDAPRRVLLVRQPAAVQRSLANWLAEQGLLASP